LKFAEKHVAILGSSLSTHTTFDLRTAAQLSLEAKLGKRSGKAEKTKRDVKLKEANCRRASIEKL
jgi:hypothetical protein